VSFNHEPDLATGVSAAQQPLQPPLLQGQVVLEWVLWGLIPIDGSSGSVSLNGASRSAEATPTRRACLCTLTQARCDLGHMEDGAERGVPSVRAGSAADRRTTDNSGQRWSPNVSQIHRSLHLQPPDLGRGR
jgi:hypothetical protein